VRSPKSNTVTRILGALNALTGGVFYRRASKIAYSSPFGRPFQWGFGQWFQLDSATPSSGDSAAGSGRLGRTDGARRRGRMIVTH
jgi:hypothetical protein